MADDDDDGNGSSLPPKTDSKPAYTPPVAKPAPTPKPAAKPAETAVKTPVNTGPVGDWREVQVHFGKKAGVPLGELEENSLVWYITKWTPTDKPGYPITEKDVKLRKALDLAGASLALPGFGVPPPAPAEDDLGF